MRQLAVFVHFDAQGLVAPHVTRWLDQFTTPGTDLVVVSSAPLTDSSRRQLNDYGQLISRDNFGYDFYSWRAGLQARDFGIGYDRVVLANDSTVGPLLPISTVLPEGDGTPAIRGITANQMISPHLQSYCLAFDRDFVATPAFQAFWRTMSPISERYVVIRRYEVGLSRIARACGFDLVPYLTPTDDEARQAAMQAARVGNLQDLDLQAASTLPLPKLPPLDHSLIYGHLALQSGRMPTVKLRMLRTDPYQIGATDLLARLESAYPREFAGVAEYLDRTGSN